MGFVEFDLDGQVDIRGAGKFVAGVGTIMVGLSFSVTYDVPVLAVEFVALIGGKGVFLRDTFGLDFGSRNAT